MDMAWRWITFSPDIEFYVIRFLYFLSCVPRSYSYFAPVKFLLVLFVQLGYYIFYENKYTKLTWLHVYVYYFLHNFPLIFAIKGDYTAIYQSTIRDKLSYVWCGAHIQGCYTLIISHALLLRRTSLSLRKLMFNSPDLTMDVDLLTLKLPFIINELSVYALYKAVIVCQYVS